MLKLNDNLVSFVGKSIDQVRSDSPFAPGYDISFAPHLALAIGATALSFTPVIGPILGPLVYLLGEALFPKQSRASDVWANVASQVEVVVDQHIQAFYLEELASEVEGLETNMRSFQTVWHDFERAKPSDRDAQAEALRTHFIGFVSTLQTSVPRFQLPSYAVVSLSQFVLAANLHLTMLTLGITNGRDWGLTQDYIDHLLFNDAMEKTGQSQRKRKRQDQNGGKDAVVTSGPTNSSGTATTSKSVGDMELDLLSGAIHTGQSRGWAPALVSTWQKAYDVLSNNTNGSNLHKRDKRPYTQYVQDVYLDGRTKVKPYPSDPYIAKWPIVGSEATANTLRAYADYDASMIQYVFAYSAQWPEMVLQKGLSQSTLRQLDREIWSGPYRRYGNDAYGIELGPDRWNATVQPAVTPRGANISSFDIYTDQVVHALTVRYRDGTSVTSGNVLYGTRYDYSLDSDDYVSSVDLQADYLIQALALKTNKTEIRPPTTNYDPASKYHVAANHTGYSLSSININRWTPDASGGLAGAAGIFAGFRPLYLQETN